MLGDSRSQGLQQQHLLLGCLCCLMSSATMPASFGLFLCIPVVSTVVPQISSLSMALVDRCAGSKITALYPQCAARYPSPFEGENASSIVKLPEWILHRSVRSGRLAADATPIKCSSGGRLALAQSQKAPNRPTPIARSTLRQVAASQHTPPMTSTLCLTKA